MTRIYYTDPYVTDFEARVIESLSWEGQPAVILDATAFYPTSGGQPSDRGSLAGIPVLDVVEREQDGAIVHVLSERVEEQHVVAQVAWGRRFDHMQQHTGQHILSAAFERVLQASTVGFHLGADASNIDVDAADLEMDDVQAVEKLANEILWGDRRVSIRFVDGESVDELGVEPPPEVDGPVRLIEIAGRRGTDAPSLDVNPCGGTHVSRTGEIGLIKIVGLEHRGLETRVEFLCGGRAVRDYEDKRDIAATLGEMLTVGTWELPDAVRRLQQENKRLRRAERELRKELSDAESKDLLNRAETWGDYRVVPRIWENRAPEELRMMALKVAEDDDAIALLCSIEERVHLCFARGAHVDVDVNELLQHVCSRLDGKGGGRSHIAQGSAPRASRPKVEDVLRDLRRILQG